MTDRTIKNWQIHNLTYPDGVLNDEYGDGVLPMVVTGTIVEDRTGKFKPGWHCRSSLITEIDLENGIIRTISKSFTLEGEEGDPTFGNKDVGNFVLKTFY